VSSLVSSGLVFACAATVLESSGRWTVPVGGLERGGSGCCYVGNGTRLDSTPFTASTATAKTELAVVVHPYYRPQNPVPLLLRTKPKKKDPRLPPEVLTPASRNASSIASSSALAERVSCNLSSEAGSHRQPLAACLLVGDFVVSTANVSLTPLESLCFEQVSFWVGVVARNNGKSGRVVAGTPWTRLPASDFVTNLEQRLPFVSITVRQVRKALNRLVELGLVVREQLTQRDWKSDYWYTVPDCTGALAASDAVSAADAGGKVEATPAPTQPGTAQDPGAKHRSDQNGHPYLLTPSSTLPESNPNPQTPASRVDGEGACAPLEPPARDVPTVITGNPFAGLQGSVRERINALAALFDPGTVQPVSPRAVVVGNRTLHVSDGACAPLR